MSLPEEIFNFLSQPVWKPAADVYRLRSGWLIKVELAGVRMEDVRVQVAGRQVRIGGRRRDLLIQRDWTQYSMELSYNQFERRIELPCELDRASLSLEFREGILLIRIDMEGEDRG